MSIGLEGLGVEDFDGVAFRKFRSLSERSISGVDSFGKTLSGG